jgi:hypothetical protein
MGQSAGARLIYGFDFGECDNHEFGVPEWLAKHSSFWGTDEANECHYGNFSLIERYGCRTFIYGHHDVPRFAFGVEIAWAMDWGSELVQLEEIVKTVKDNEARLVALLNELDSGSSSIDQKSIGSLSAGIHLLAEYG